MKKSFAFFLVSFFILVINNCFAFYSQQINVFIFAENSALKNKLNFMLSSSGVTCSGIDSLKSIDPDSLYIIGTDVQNLNVSKMPQNYILYQTNILKNNLPQTAIKILNQAIAIWDENIHNINIYQKISPNYYYLKAVDKHCADPLVLPCFLPTKALNAYRHILTYSNTQPSDISSHLPTLFCHCIFQNPSIMVEAGVRWGNGSTIALNLANQISGSQLIGIDIQDCSHIYSKLHNAHFLLINDLDFIQHFNKMNFSQKVVDFVFIDTSHQYEHTIKEIPVFESILSEKGTIGFHDTNPVPGDPRGALDGFKAYFNLSFDETKYFRTTFEKDGYRWRVVHYPYCNGMAVTQRLGSVDFSS